MTYLRNTLAGFIAVMTIAAVTIALPADAAPRKRGTDRSGLNLSSEQRTKLQKVMSDTLTKSSKARKDVRDAHDELVKLYSSHQMDQNRVQSTIKRMNNGQLEVLNVNLSSQVGIREILSSDQFSQLRSAVSSKGERVDDGHHTTGWEEPDLGNSKELNLSSHQQERIQRLFVSSSKQMRELEMKLRNDSASLRQIYLKYDLDTSAAQSRIRSTNRTQLQILNATASRQTELRKILTQEQFEAFRKTIRHDRTNNPRRGRGR